MARGRIGRSSRRIPRAIAPEVTMITSSPAAWRTATSSQRAASTSARTSPASSATTLVPSLTTTRMALFKLEGHAADLDVVARLEAGGLERAADAERFQALLEVLERVGVADVVAGDEAVDALAGHAEHAGARALHVELATGAGAEDPVGNGRLRLDLLPRRDLAHELRGQLVETG